MNIFFRFSVCVLCILIACQPADTQTFTATADILIQNGTVYNGENMPGKIQSIAIRNDSIIWVGTIDSNEIESKTVIDATGKIVAPGFIDPHTHALGDLLDTTKNANLNYLTQGVTTVVVGNDGGGPLRVKATFDKLERQGIGTNVGIFAGHGTIRRNVMGLSQEKPSQDELERMQDWVRQAMEGGALGLSTGLYYAPGSFAETDEIIALSKIAAEYGGIYDSHIRDESSYTVGLMAAIREVIAISHEAKIPGHVSHIKALGVDVWDYSQRVIELIDSARNAGLTITANQYPYRASGTSMDNALLNRWVMADDYQAFQRRLKDPELLPRIREEMKENLRKRGGPSSLLIISCKNSDWVGKNLEELAKEIKDSPIDVALEIIRNGNAGVASFNMKDADLENFMQQPWVVTGSDGSEGHPRKFGTFSAKYQNYVIEKQVLSLEAFIHQSSGRTADILQITNRGYLKPGFKADVVVFDPTTYRPHADFQQPRELSSGIDELIINGKVVIVDGTYVGNLVGECLRQNK